MVETTALFALEIPKEADLQWSAQILMREIQKLENVHQNDENQRRKWQRKHAREEK